MIKINEAVNTLLKSMDETLKRCQMTVVYPDGVKKDQLPIEVEGDKTTILFTSNDGSIKIELADQKLSLYCTDEKASKASQEDYKRLFVSLLDIEDEACDVRDIKSAANEICESVEKYFGISKDSKSNKKQAKPSAKKGGKNSTISYEPENLGVRISNIFPELKDEFDSNVEKYEMFLPEEFFNEHANELIVNAIKTNNEGKIKKLFNTFNMFYEEGPKDTQSLVAVSILAMNLKDDKDLYDRVEGYMDKDLRSAVSHVIKYLSSHSGKRAVKELENPKPYVSKKIKKA